MIQGQQTKQLHSFIQQDQMDRAQVITKIQSMLRLQESTSFDGEAAAAAKLIEKLCNQYGISLEEASNPVAVDETFSEFKRMNSAYATLLNAVAKFYDAFVYINHNDGHSFKVIGTERQQIETKVYFEYLWEVLEKEAETAYKAEKVIAFLQDKKVDRSYKANFKKAFATTISDRLFEMKRQKEDHEHKEAVKAALSTRRFGRAKNLRGAAGAGAVAGGSIGAGVSLHRQQGAGASRRALAGV